MAQNKFLSFLNSLDKGANDRNSITEFLANVLTPGDEMEYVNGSLMTTGGKPVENIGDKTYYGTLGQANFAGNDPVKDGLLSKMTEAPDKVARKLGLLNEGQPEVVNDMMPGENTFAYTEPAMPNPLAGEIIEQSGSLYTPEEQENLEFYKFVEEYKDDPLFSSVINDNTKMREIFKLMKAEMKPKFHGALLDPETLNRPYEYKPPMFGPGTGSIIEPSDYMKKKLGIN